MESCLICIKERCKRDFVVHLEGIINYDTASYIIVVNMESVAVKREAADISETLINYLRNAVVNNSADHS
jgi:hypothetical protein